MNEKDFEKNISCAFNAIHQGKVVLVNTDTVPGMAVNPQLPQAVSEVYRLKGRKWYKPLVWMVEDFKIISGMLEVSSHAEVLMKKYWPGALTLIFRVKNPLHPFLQTLNKNGELGVGMRDCLAVRIPAGDKSFTTLLKKINQPLAVTSVNRSGSDELISWDTIEKEFGGALDYSLYSNQKIFQSFNKNKNVEKVVTPSTVVDVRETPKVIRSGLIMLDD